ncbi:MAG TPA: bZIP transcription factor [Sedimentisphaerales bacterium]|nr:bZIP transcription factor [Sedimentisphaerales bacterium]
MKSGLKKGTIAGVIAVVVIALGTIVAEDVVVKQGGIGAGSVSPDPRAKVFITDGPADIYYQDCYGLLTMTTDPSAGSENMCGMLCEFFPDATAGLGGSVSGWLFNYPVGTQNNSAYHYSLYADTAGSTDDYSTGGQTVGLVGVGAAVNNYNDVSGGYYQTKGLSVFSEPVENGYEMSGALTFKNYGVEVYASLDGDYQATSGTGENFGAKITTTEDFATPADKLVNSYALYLEPFTSSTMLGGGKTYGIYQEGSGVMNYFEGDVTVAGIFDNTPGYTGSAQDALSEIVNTRSVDGEIEHSSLPALARATLKRVEKTNQRIVEYTDPTGKVREREEYDIEIVEEEGRSLGGMITVLTEAVKGLNEKVETLQAENQTLKAEIAALKAQ